ncbi:unnamed protein product [Blepharisma stoltei]|uniref:RING-type domain-containing protein n=1 Tax=Blepharisma stoltei TaxID=1481888 RepID=A0AAU9JUW9_9CILI|nr:unnamed protein product [Blepharisma stoltei]
MNCANCDESKFVKDCLTCQKSLCRVCQCKDICTACESCGPKIHIRSIYDLISLCEKCFSNRIKDFESPICFLNSSGAGGEEEDLTNIQQDVNSIINKNISDILFYAFRKNIGEIGVEPNESNMEESLIQDIKDKVVSKLELVIIATNTLSHSILKDLCELIRDMKLNIVWYKPDLKEMHAIVPTASRKAKPKDLAKIIDEISSEGYPLCTQSRIIKKFQDKNLRFDFNKLIETTERKNYIKLLLFEEESENYLLLASKNAPAINSEIIEGTIKFFENSKLVPFLFRIQEMLLNVYGFDASLNFIEGFVHDIPGYEVYSSEYRQDPQNYIKKVDDGEFRTVFHNGQINQKSLEKYEAFLAFLEKLIGKRMPKGVLALSLLFKHLYMRNKPKLSIQEIYEFFEFGIQERSIAIKRKKLVQVSQINKRNNSDNHNIPLFKKTDFVTPQECINMVIGILLERRHGIQITDLFHLVRSLFSPRVVSLTYLGYFDFEDLLTCIDDVEVANNYVIYSLYKHPEECPYCMEELEEDDTKLECSHQFHNACLIEIVNKSIKKSQSGVICPMCRTPLTENMIKYIIDPARQKKKVEKKDEKKHPEKRKSKSHPNWLIPGIMKCFTNNCQYFFDPGCACKYTCPLCKIEYCLKCAIETKRECECAINAAKENQEFLNWIEMNNGKVCPKCGIVTLNETNKSIVKCSSCHTTFCFQCGKLKKGCVC